jgi:hypothetical protein
MTSYDELWLPPTQVDVISTAGNCPDCTNGRVVLFSSDEQCGSCHGTGYVETSHGTTTRRPHDDGRARDCDMAWTLNPRGSAGSYIRATVVKARGSNPCAEILLGGMERGHLPAPDLRGDTGGSKSTPYFTNPPYQVTGRTGRWHGRGPNLQNLPGINFKMHDSVSMRLRALSRTLSASAGAMSGMGEVFNRAQAKAVQFGVAYGLSPDKVAAYIETDRLTTAKTHEQACAFFNTAVKGVHSYKAKGDNLEGSLDKIYAMPADTHRVVEGVLDMLDDHTTIDADVLKKSCEEFMKAYPGPSDPVPVDVDYTELDKSMAEMYAEGTVDAVRRGAQVTLEVAPEPTVGESAEKITPPAKRKRNGLGLTADVMATLATSWNARQAEGSSL